jgi:hypothetical protein
MRKFFASQCRKNVDRDRRDNPSYLIDSYIYPPIRSSYAVLLSVR